VSGKTSSGSDALELAKALSLACEQCRASIESHQRASSELLGHERALRQSLEAILSAIVPEAAGRPSTKTVERLAVSMPPESHSPIDLKLARPTHPPEPDQRPHDWAAEHESARPALSIYCLGPLQVYCHDRLLTQWPNGRSKSIFKYLITHRPHPVSKEVLMDLFWPSATAHAARNNLNVAIFGLRQTFPKTDTSPPCIIFKDDCYALNPVWPIWVDYDDFLAHVASGEALDRQGQHEAAIHEYGVAETLYRGDLFEDSRSEDWSAGLRQTLRDQYRQVLDRLATYYFNAGNYDASAKVNAKMILADSCDESAHRRLMQCYARQGLPHLALRQYHCCVEALKEELDVAPSQETDDLVQGIKRGQPV
jgi:DNA-binding SARP family transcriptional activator